MDVHLLKTQLLSLLNRTELLTRLLLPAPINLRWRRAMLDLYPIVESLTPEHLPTFVKGPDGSLFIASSVLPEDWDYLTVLTKDNEMQGLSAGDEEERPEDIIGWRLPAPPASEASLLPDDTEYPGVTKTVFTTVDGAEVEFLFNTDGEHDAFLQGMIAGAGAAERQLWGVFGDIPWSPPDLAPCQLSRLTQLRGQLQLLSAPAKDALLERLMTTLYTTDLDPANEWTQGTIEEVAEALNASIHCPEQKSSTEEGTGL